LANKEMNALIFDIGKTNKKLLVFDGHFDIIHEESMQFDEIKDEDGFPCDDLDKISHWIIDQFKIQNSKFKISRVNFSAYGASWVHLDENGKPLTPLYNYLKPFHKELEKQFEAQFGLEKVAQETGSPYSGMLNSGLQLYWLKYAKPDIFKQVKYSLHLPQYLSFLITGKAVSEFTSIGCHTMLWDYRKNNYHDWVYAEGIDKILPPIVTASHTEIINIGSSQIEVGPGIHDSSASLFPYFKKSKEPFMLLSTGTWCVAMNPFIEFKEKESLKFKEELFYMTIEGKPVKATRLMLGKEFDEGISKIANEMGQPKFKIQSLKGNESLNLKLETLNSKLAKKQIAAILEAKGNSEIKKLYVEGGFSKNEMFLKMLKESLSDWDIIPSENSQGTALGAAMVING
jgi:sugar (pentulose or hexulose) kinase